MFGWGGRTVDISGGCLEGIHLRHFKPMAPPFLGGPIRFPEDCQRQSNVEPKRWEWCRVVTGVKVKRGNMGLEWRKEKSSKRRCECRA